MQITNMNCRARAASVHDHYTSTRDMRIQFGSLLADIGLINLPKKYQVQGQKKEDFDSWFSDASQPFNKYSCHSSVVKVRPIRLLFVFS